MRKVIIPLLAATAFLISIAPASAATNADCGIVPKGEWAQCILDRAGGGY